MHTLVKVINQGYLMSAFIKISLGRNLLKDSKIGPLWWFFEHGSSYAMQLWARSCTLSQNYTKRKKANKQQVLIQYIVYLEDAVFAKFVWAVYWILKLDFCINLEMLNIEDKLCFRMGDLNIDLENY